MFTDVLAPHTYLFYHRGGVWQVIFDFLFCIPVMEGTQNCKCELPVPISYNDFY